MVRHIIVYCHIAIISLEAISDLMFHAPYSSVGVGSGRGRGRRQVGDGLEHLIEEEEEAHISLD